MRKLKNISINAGVVTYIRGESIDGTLKRVDEVQYREWVKA